MRTLRSCQNHISLYAENTCLICQRVLSRLILRDFAHCDNNWSSRRDIISVQCHDSTTFSFHSDLCGNIQCRDAMSRENEQWYAQSFSLTRETNATLFLEACLYSERQNLRGAEYTFVFLAREKKKGCYAMQFSIFAIWIKVFSSNFLTSQMHMYVFSKHENDHWRTRVDSQKYLYKELCCTHVKNIPRTR